MLTVNRRALGWKHITRAMGAMVLLLSLWMGVGASAMAQDAGYDLDVGASLCAEQPPLPPTFEGADCDPADGVVIEVVSDAGNSVGTCTTVASADDDNAAYCTVAVPYDTSFKIYEDDGSLPAGYVPVQEPLFAQSSEEGGSTGLNLTPMFINLLADDTDEETTDDDSAEVGTTDTDGSGTTTTLPDTGVGEAVQQRSVDSTAALLTVIATTMLGGSLAILLWDRAYVDAKE